MELGIGSQEDSVQKIPCPGSFTSIKIYIYLSEEAQGYSDSFSGRHVNVQISNGGQMGRCCS